MRSVRTQTPDVRVVESQQARSHAEGTASGARDQEAGAESSDDSNLMPRVDGESGSVTRSSSSPVTLSLDPAVRPVYDMLTCYIS